TVMTQRHERGHAHEQRVPVENSGVRPNAKVRPKWREEIAVLIERHAAHHVAERRAEKENEQDAGGAEGDIPELVPKRVLQLMTNLDPERAEQEQPEHDHQ